MAWDIWLVLPAASVAVTVRVWSACVSGGRVADQVAGAAAAGKVVAHGSPSSLKVTPAAGTPLNTMPAAWSVTCTLTVGVVPATASAGASRLTMAGGAVSRACTVSCRVTVTPGATVARMSSGELLPGSAGTSGSVRVSCQLVTPAWTAAAGAVHGPVPIWYCQLAALIVSPELPAARGTPTPTENESRVVVMMPEAGVGLAMLSTLAAVSERVLEAVVLSVAEVTVATSVRTPAAGGVMTACQVAQSLLSLTTGTATPSIVRLTLVTSAAGVDPAVPCRVNGTPAYS
jgi:hypothetical protein